MGRIIYKLNDSSTKGAIESETSWGRIIMGRIIYKMGEMSLGRIVLGANRLGGESLLGRIVYGGGESSIYEM